MKILLLQDDFPPEAKGGSAIAVATLALVLRRLGHDVSVITTTQNLKHQGEELWRDIPVHRLYTEYPERWRAYRSLRNRAVLPEIAKILIRLRPDIVHVHNVHRYISYAVLPLAKQTGAKVVLTAHDALLYHYGKDAHAPSFFNLLRNYKWRFNPLRQFFIRRYMWSVDSIIAVSEALSEALAQHGFSAKVIYNGVELQRWRVSPETVLAFKEKYSLADKKVILFGGRVSDLKGAPQALAMINAIQKEFPNAQLLLVGRARLPGAVTTGWLSGEDLVAAYGASDLVIYPSVYLDPFGLVIIEAMAASKPVVASMFGGAKEAVVDGETGYVVDPRNTKQFAGCVSELLGNEELSIRMGNAGHHRVEKYFTAERMGRQYVALYEHIKA